MESIECLNPTVSVIVPVYNSAHFLVNTVKSILTEEFASFELLLIDDGSTDESGELADDIAREDNRIRVIHKQNGGICSARNAGLNVAKGKYVTFCDNDDIVLPGFIGENVRILEETNADCVRFGIHHLIVEADGSISKDSYLKPECLKEFSQGNLISRLPEIDWGGVQGVWCCMYRRSLIVEHRISFHEGFKQGFEDLYFNDQFLEHAQSIVWNPGVYYCWIQRRTHSTSMKIDESAFESASFLMKLETELYARTGLIHDNPEYCARRFVSYVRSFIVYSCFGRGRSYKEERDVYELSRKTLLPYKTFLERYTEDTAANFISECLFNRKYILLYVASAAGTFAKQTVRKCTSITRAK